MESFRLRPFKQGDEFSINEKFNLVFGLERTLEEWYWKFQPEKDGCGIMLSVDEKDDIVAQYAAIKMPVQIDDSLYHAGQPVDVFCLRFGGTIQQLIYVKTVREFFRCYGKPNQFPLLFGFPSKRHLRLGRLKLGYGEPVPVLVWRKPIGRKSSMFRNIGSVQSSCDASMIDRLWQRSVHRYPVSVIRNGDWVKRRYFERPDNNYLHLSLSKNDELHAWSVLQVSNDVARFVDLLWDGEDPQDLIDLEQEMENQARLRGVKNFEMWLSGDKSAEEIFANIGWVGREHPQLEMVARSFHPEIESNHFLNNFYLTLGGSDLV